MSTLKGWFTVDGKTVPSPPVAEDAVRALLLLIGEDPDRQGLTKTPERFIKALLEVTSGYQADPGKILETTFDISYDEVVILRDIPFSSTCEHHIQPFVGTVDVGYIPGKVVGLSKLARLVDCYSQRLQVQERMTKQIADAIETYLHATGTAVVVKASHSCMSCRGVKKPGATMVTSCCLGAFRTEPSARAEFLALCGG